MIKIKRYLLSSILIASLIISGSITIIAFQKNEWETMASAMGVITAVLAIWSSLNLLWKQEDDLLPSIIIYIDHTSHKYAYSLVLTNIGGSPAYDVKIEWIQPLLDIDNKLLRFTEYPDDYDFHYLPEKKPHYRFIFGSENIKALFNNSDKPLIYSGRVSYSLKSGSRYRISTPFKLSLEPFKRRLNVQDDQMDFYFENKNLTKELRQIKSHLEKISNSLENKQN